MMMDQVSKFSVNKTLGNKFDNVSEMDDVCWSQSRFINRRHISHDFLSHAFDIYFDRKELSIG